MERNNDLYHNMGKMHFILLNSVSGLIIDFSLVIIIGCEIYSPKGVWTYEGMNHTI